jgi:hypothetical protein
VFLARTADTNATAATKPTENEKLGLIERAWSYVIIDEGCPLVVTTEGTDHVLIRCGGARAMHSRSLFIGSQPDQVGDLLG